MYFWPNEWLNCPEVKNSQKLTKYCRMPEGGVSSETAIQGADKTTLPFNPLKGGHIIWFNILKNMAYESLNPR